MGVGTQWLVSLLLVSSVAFVTHSYTSSLHASPAHQATHVDGSMLPPSLVSHPVLSRTDPQSKDHASFLLFKNPRAGQGGALDTASHPELGVGERVHHKTKSFAALGRAVQGALRHYAGAAMGLQAGQPKRSLLETATPANKKLHTLAHQSAVRMRTMSKVASEDTQAKDTASPTDTAVADSPSSSLHVTYLVHFAPSVVLNEELFAEFHRLTGLELGDYFPHRSYLLVAPSDRIADIRALLPTEMVDWVGEYPNDAKVVSPALHALVTLSPQALEERSEETIKGLALNIQLQPLDGRAVRTKEQLDAFAALVGDFLAAQGLGEEAFTVLAPPSFHHDLLILRALRSLTLVEVSSLLDSLSQLVEVHAIEQRLEHRFRNEIAQQLTQSGTDDAGANGDGRTIWAKGIMGEGQIVGCADSGCDYDHCFFNGAGAATPTSTPNLSLRKVVAYVQLPGADKTDDVGGHGTHVTGSIVGNALGVTAAGGDIAEHSGQAPEAKLYFQDIGVTGGGLGGLAGVSDLGAALFQPALDAGAHIHSDSWGSMDNSYTTEAQSVDRWIWQSGGQSMKKMLILVAAGNDGLKEGSVQATVGSPATAKNILAVGASQTTNQGWQDSTEFTDWEMKRRDAAEQLGQNPASFDCCAPRSNAAVAKYCCESTVKADIQATPELHQEGNMADFSSRGPTADGRVKPEIVAPGQYIISAKSDGVKNGQDQCTTKTEALISMAGTSMATPTLAGNAALLRQYLAEGWSEGGVKGASDKFRDPSAQLMAAMLINGAQSLTGQIDQFNDGSHYASLKDGIFPLSVFQGFGRVTLDRSMWFAGETRYNQWKEDSAVEMSTGKDVDYCFTPTSSGPVKATMVYHDAPGQVGAGVATTNNLDLYIGHSADNAVAGNFVVRRDTLNNAESAIFQARANQRVYVKIRAIQVAVPRQTYALVFSGQFDPQEVQIGSACGAASAFSINGTRFEEATDEDHFPLGPVVGGVVGGVGGLALCAAVAKVAYDRYRKGGVV